MVKRRRSKKWIYWVVFVVLVVGAGVVCYLVWDNYFRGDIGNNADTQEVEGDDAENSDADSNSSDGSGGVEKEKVEQYDGQYSGGDPNDNNELTGVVTYAGVNDGILRIRVNIDQYLEEGTCSLTLAQGGRVVYRDTAGIVGVAATATCEGFDIDMGNLNGGNTQIEIKIVARGKEGVIRGETEL
ncbi:hypothetical protein IJG04_03175 [Candidatus Saccharibacteria bacterium]|nr:hypothetical protein [Candidatus Saccharibacteria bacterium]